jgi:hypothetical protein
MEFFSELGTMDRVWLGLSFGLVMFMLIHLYTTGGKP